MSDLIDRQALLNEYDKAHVGPPGKARKLIEDAPTASPWHRVEEELPKDGETVLIYCENTGGIVKSHYHEYRRAGKLVDFLFSGGAYFPKYWMPLPEPPKEENNA